MICRFSLILFLFSSACGSTSDWDDVPTATVTPAPTSYPGWQDEVETAVRTWQAEMLERNCLAPFVVGSDGHEIKLIELEDWPHDHRLVGWTLGDDLLGRGVLHVKNRATSGREEHIAVLLHELGHALGLGHSKEDFGPSIMLDPVRYNRIYPRDTEAAACALGCGTCDLIDHFDERD